MVVLLLIHSLLLVTLFVWVLCLVHILLCSTLCPFNVCNHLDGEERAGCFTFSFFLISCDCLCSVALPRGALGWSAYCDYGISWSYSLLLCLGLLFWHCRRHVLKHISEHKGHDGSILLLWINSSSIPKLASFLNFHCVDKFWLVHQLEF